MNNVLIHEPNSFRQYLLSQDPHYRLFKELITRVLEEPDPGLMSQYVEVMRILLDTENFEEVSILTPPPNSFTQLTKYPSLQQAALRDQFLTFFYKHLLKDLVAPLDGIEEKEKTGEQVNKGTVLQIYSRSIHPNKN